MSKRKEKDEILTSFSLSSTGLPTKAMILTLWFFPCLCFRANCIRSEIDTDTL